MFDNKSVRLRVSLTRYSYASSAVLLMACFIAFLVVQPPAAHAEGLIETGPYAGLGSLAVLALCAILQPDRKDCYAAAIMADPIGLGVESTSMTLQYDPNLFTFNPAQSGFLCQFSSGGDCPAANGATGAFPLQYLPPTGFHPGQPLPGSTVQLTYTGSSVTLQY
jgi:hypothetical protein